MRSTKRQAALGLAALALAGTIGAAGTTAASAAPSHQTTSHTAAKPQRALDIVLPGGSELDRGNSMYANNSTLTMQNDGNLVLYCRSNPVWMASNSWPNGNRAVMQGDGNFVVYDGGGSALWSSGTSGHPGAYLQVQGDGNLVIYQAGQAIWSTNTQCR
ncbi:hypothetical protein ACIHFE_12235 [Streptomyces sp. NPDC052396]|uniref:hypothetical protein n=1 Tax=Streptomyces sp. NPDC052396 TaxID=3365689 RepID=UPI0037D5EFAB